MERSCWLGFGRDEGFVGYTWDADMQNQFNGMIRNKVIYQKVANAMAERRYSRTWHQC